jgi:pimeloyl-ACP methyl ester carboxylesterase
MPTNYAAQARFTRETATVNGVHVAMLVSGAGEPLVFLHGAETFHGFDFALPWATRYRVIIPYHPGWGNSGDAPQLATLHDYVLHYLDLFDRLRLARINLIGFSLGGLLAALFSVEHSYRLHKLVLVAPAGMNVPKHPAADISRVPPEVLPEYLAEDQSVVTRHMPTQPSPKFVAARERELQNFFRIAGSGPFDPTLRQWLHRVRVPTMLLWGEMDRLIPVQHANVWANLIPGSRLRRVPGAGHLVLDEKSDAVTAVFEFLA